MLTDVPTDIGALKIDCLARWQNNFCLAMSCDEFDAMTNDIQSLWVSAASGLDQLEREVFLCDGFPFWFNQILHAHIWKNDIGPSAKNLKSTELSNNFLTPDWSSIGSQHERAWQKNNYLMTLRSVAKTFIGLRLENLTKTLPVGAPLDFCLGSNSILRSEYMSERGILARHLYPSQLIGKLDIKCTHSDKFMNDIRSFFDEVFALKWSLRAGFDKSFKSSLIATIFERQAFLKSIYKSVLQKKILPGSHLLVNESARPVHKVIAAAWRYQGGRSVGFHHGAAAGERIHKDRAIREYFAYSDFVCPNRAVARAFSKEFELGTRDLPVTACNFDYVVKPNNASGLHAKSETSLIQIADIAKPRKVLIMGYPMNAIRYYAHHGMNWQSRLNLELKIVQLLLKSGCEVCYKAHPERTKYVSKIMQSVGASVYEEKFENLSVSPDYYIVTYSESSSFPQVLRTKTPILFVNPQLDTWQKQHSKLIKQRCIIIDSCVRADGEIWFDASQIRGALKKKFIQISSEYYDSFYT